MAIEKKEQIFELIPQETRDKVKVDLEEYFSKLEQPKEFGTDDFNSFVADAVNQPLVDKLFDKRVQLAIDKFKDKFMKEKFPDLMESEIKKRFPAKTQEEIENAELRESMASLKEEIRIKDQVNIAQSKMDGLFEGIDPKIFVGESDEETINNVKKFKESALAWKNQAVSEKDKEWMEKTSTSPQAGQGGIIKKYSECNLDERAMYFKTHGKDKYEAWKRAG